MRECIGASENLWRLTGLNLMKTLYTTSISSDKKQMFTIVKSLISPKENNTPYFSSMQEGCTRFSEYFTNKTRLLLSKIDCAQHTLGAETQLYTEPLNSFTNTNTMNVLELLMSTK